MRIAILIPADLRHEVALVVATAAGLDELREAGCAVLDLGVADPRLGDGVAPVRQLMPLWTVEAQALHDLNERLRDSSVRPMQREPKFSGLAGDVVRGA